MKDFFKSFFAFGLATSLQKLLGFIVLPIYTKYFNPEEYGVIEMVNTILSIGTVFGILQLETSLQRYYYDTANLKRKLLVSNVYGWIILASVLASVILVVGSNYLSNTLFDTTNNAILIVLIALQLPFANISVLGLILLRFQKQNLKFLAVVIVNVICSVTFVYLFVVIYQFGLRGVFYAQLGAIILSTTLVTIFVKNLLVFKYSPLNTQKLFRYALPQFPARMGSMLLGQSSKFFMLGFLSLSAIGIYSVSYKLASSIQLLNTAFIMAWAPFMHAQFKKENNKKVFANVFPLVVGATSLCVCIITLLSYEMVKLLATDEFYEAHKYVGGLSLFFALYIIKEIVDIGPKIKEKTKYLSLTFFISVLVNIVALFSLINLMELRGVVLAMIVTNLTLVIISWIVSNKLYYISFSIGQFIILISPALILSIISLYTEFTIVMRIILGIIILCFYTTLFLVNYKKFKEII